MSQLNIDFTRVLHRRENSAENETHLHKNKFHFTGQCAVVYSLLKKGIRLTAREAMITYNIGHLARRIADLKQAGVVIESEFAQGENYKEYFMSQ